jgi:hypothetical protein
VSPRLFSRTIVHRPTGRPTRPDVSVAGRYPRNTGSIHTGFENNFTDGGAAYFAHFDLICDISISGGYIDLGKHADARVGFEHGQFAMVHHLTIAETGPVALRLRRVIQSMREVMATTQ